jgi:hypothetical protein
MAKNKMGPPLPGRLHHGRDVPSYFIDTEGARHDFNRVAIEERGGRVSLSQLHADECVIAPGLIYRRAALHSSGQKDKP